MINLEIEKEDIRPMVLTLKKSLWNLKGWLDGFENSYQAIPIAWNSDTERMADYKKRKEQYDRYVDDNNRKLKLLKQLERLAGVHAINLSSKFDGRYREYYTNKR